LLFQETVECRPTVVHSLLNFSKFHSNPLLMLAFVPFRQFQIFARSLLSFLDESMQQNHSASLIDIEKHARDSVLNQSCPHLINAVAQRSAGRHSDRPAELDRLDVLADPLPILLLKIP
jgi:hypothetical protein